MARLPRTGKMWRPTNGRPVAWALYFAAIPWLTDCANADAWGNDPLVLRERDLRLDAVAACQDTAFTYSSIARMSPREWNLQVTWDPDSGRYLETQGMVSGADPNWVHREVRCRWDTVTKATTRVTIR